MLGLRLEPVAGGSAEDKKKEAQSIANRLQLPVVVKGLEHWAGDTTIFPDKHCVIRNPSTQWYFSNVQKYSTSGQLAGYLFTETKSEAMVFHSREDAEKMKLAIDSYFTIQTVLEDV